MNNTVQTDATYDGPLAILGLGLMGGSLALAVRRREPGRELRVYARREETRARAREAGLADAVCGSPAEAVRGAGLVVACVPVLAIPRLVAEAAPGLAPGAVVTDVGSTKAWLAREVPAALGPDAVFVGSHPVAGSERQGLEAAAADLYDGALAVVTPAGGEPPGAVSAVEALWTGAGSRVRRMAPGEHDRLMARTSHLPHLAAALLAHVAARPGDTDGPGAFCGTGFRDSTRVAEGSPGVWMDIVRTNRDALAEETERLAGAAAGLAAALRRGDDAAVRLLLEEARSRRRGMLGEASGPG